MAAVRHSRIFVPWTERYSGSSDIAIYGLDASGRSFCQEFATDRTIRDVAFSPDCTRIAAALEDATIRQFDVANLAGPISHTLRSTDRNDIELRELEFSPDSLQLAATSLRTRRSFVWNTATGALVRSISSPTRYEDACQWPFMTSELESGWLRINEAFSLHIPSQYRRFQTYKVHGPLVVTRGETGNMVFIRVPEECCLMYGQVR